MPTRPTSVVSILRSSGTATTIRSIPTSTGTIITPSIGERPFTWATTGGRRQPSTISPSVTAVSPSASAGTTGAGVAGAGTAPGHTTPGTVLPGAGTTGAGAVAGITATGTATTTVTGMAITTAFTPEPMATRTTTTAMTTIVGITDPAVLPAPTVPVATRLVPTPPRSDRNTNRP